MKRTGPLNVWDYSVQHKGVDGSMDTEHLGKGRSVIYGAGRGDCETTCLHGLGFEYFFIFLIFFFISAENLI